MKAERDFASREGEESQQPARARIPGQAFRCESEGKIMLKGLESTGPGPAKRALRIRVHAPAAIQLWG